MTSLSASVSLACLVPQERDLPRPLPELGGLAPHYPALADVSPATAQGSDLLGLAAARQTHLLSGATCDTGSRWSARTTESATGLPESELHWRQPWYGLPTGYFPFLSHLHRNLPEEKFSHNAYLPQGCLSHGSSSLSSLDTKRNCKSNTKRHLKPFMLSCTLL